MPTSSCLSSHAPPLVATATTTQSSSSSLSPLLAQVTTKITSSSSLTSEVVSTMTPLPSQPVRVPDDNDFDGDYDDGISSSSKTSSSSSSSDGTSSTEMDSFQRDFEDDDDDDDENDAASSSLSSSFLSNQSSSVSEGNDFETIINGNTSNSCHIKVVRFADEAGIPLEDVLLYIPPTPLFCPEEENRKRRRARIFIDDDVDFDNVQELVLLLIEPRLKKFECLHVGYRVPPSSDSKTCHNDENREGNTDTEVTVQDLLDQIPTMASDPLFSNAKYSSLHSMPSMTLGRSNVGRNTTSKQPHGGGDDDSRHAHFYPLKLELKPRSKTQSETVMTLMQPVLLKECQFVSRQIVVAAMEDQVTTGQMTRNDLLMNAAQCLTNKRLTRKLRKGVETRLGIQLVNPRQLL